MKKWKWRLLLLISISQIYSYRVISYNVLVGLQNHWLGYPANDRIAKITNWLIEQDPDVVAFQELNGFTEAELLTFAKTYGHNYAALSTEAGYPPGITSKTLITVKEKMGAPQGMSRGLVYAEIDGIEFFSTHLWPSVMDSEVGIILARVDTSKQSIILGDFNADPADAQIQRLKNEGFVDIYDKYRTSNLNYPKPWYDYIMASQNLASKSVGAKWYVTDSTFFFSDHYPVVADFDLGDSPQNISSPIEGQTHIAKTGDLRVMNFNIRTGIESEWSYIDKGLRENFIIDWINKWDPDVIQFQQLSGFTQQTLIDFSSKWGHDYALLVKETGSPVGITSKTPISLINKKDSDFGTLISSTKNITFATTLFAEWNIYFNQSKKENEVQYILDQVPVGSDFIFSGGLYSEPTANDVQLFKDSGLVDLFGKYHTSGGWNERWSHYMFASPDLSQKSIRTEQIIAEEGQVLSRYFPLVTDFQIVPVGVTDELSNNLNLNFRLSLKDNILHISVNKGEYIKSLDLFDLNGNRFFIKRNIRSINEMNFDIKNSFSSGKAPDVMIWRLATDRNAASGLLVSQ